MRRCTVPARWTVPSSAAEPRTSWYCRKAKAGRHANAAAPRSGRHSARVEGPHDRRLEAERREVQVPVGEGREVRRPWEDAQDHAPPPHSIDKNRFFQPGTLTFLAPDPRPITDSAVVPRAHGTSPPRSARD
jgi:hypothetical protein